MLADTLRCMHVCSCIVYMADVLTAVLFSTRSGVYSALGCVSWCASRYVMVTGNVVMFMGHCFILFYGLVSLQPLLVAVIVDLVLSDSLLMSVVNII